VDLQIQQQKAQRDKIQALKQQELRQERQKLQEWQQQLDQGDESDYEDNTADAAAQIISQDDQQQQQQQQNQCSSTNPAQLSEADEGYHGKGWWPSKIAKAKASPADATASSSEDGTDSAEPELTTISSNCSTSSMDSGLQQLVAGESAANQAAATCQDMLLDGAPAGNGTAVEPFVTVSSSRRLPASTGPTTNAIPGSSVKQAQRLTGCAGSSSISSRPVKPLAPVRSRAAPVQVTFTELETPHLPAREQREVEIKQIKKAAGKVCLFAAASICVVAYSLCCQMQPCVISAGSAGDAADSAVLHRQAICAQRSCCCKLLELPTALCPANNQLLLRLRLHCCCAPCSLTAWMLLTGYRHSSRTREMPLQRRATTCKC
jgi:hypothetical protein